MEGAGGTFRLNELRTITDGAPDLITVLSPDFRFLFANRAMGRATGRDPQALVGRGFAEVGFPEHVARQWLATLEQVVQTREAVQVEFEGSLVDGTRVLQSCVSPVLGDDGALLGILWITRDTTEATRAEAMRDSHDQVLRMILSGAGLQPLMETVVALAELHVRGRPSGLFLLSPDRTRLVVGHAPQLPGALLDSLCRAPLDAGDGFGDAVLQRRLTVCADLATDPAWAAHRELAQAHGLRACWAEPIVSSTGEVLGAFAMFHRRAREPYPRELRATREAALIAGVAIEHWRSRDALLEVQERFRALTENAANIVTVIDADLKQLYVSPAVTAVLGYAPEMILGMAATRSVHPEDVARVESRLRGLVDNVGAQDEVPSFRIRHLDGSWRMIESIAKSDRNRHGQVIVVVSSRDITEKRQLEQQLQLQALHDPLTGLPNRRAFEVKLTALLAGARGGDAQHALCYLDLDQFKVVNDTCGHAAGDELLRQLPEVLRRSVREKDTLARLGGDEFAILLEDCTLENAAAAAEAVRDELLRFRFVWQHREFAVGVSIGVVGVSGDSPGMVSVLGAADAACYVAKEQGPGNIHVSYPHDLAIVRRRGEMRWVARLRRALEEDQFCLHVQSIAPVSGNGAPRLHELLVRLQDAKGGLVLPGLFIPAAERYRLMGSLDRWVVENALRHIGTVLAPDPRFAGHRFGINLSGESLRTRELLGVIEEAIVRHRVPPSMLYFELTETVAITNLSAAIGFMQQLRERGCQMALDDFGSGMSSFSYLKHLPVDYLKIDGSFVRDIVKSRVDQSIVRSAHAVGRELGIATIAEHVESAPILDCLRAIGIDYAQGYGIACPQPLAELGRTRPLQADGSGTLSAG